MPIVISAVAGDDGVLRPETPLPVSDLIVQSGDAYTCYVNGEPVPQEFREYIAGAE